MSTKVITQDGRAVARLHRSHVVHVDPLGQVYIHGPTGHRGLRRGEQIETSNDADACDLPLRIPLTLPIDIPDDEEIARRMAAVAVDLPDRKAARLEIVTSEAPKRRRDIAAVAKRAGLEVPDGRTIKDRWAALKKEIKR